MIRRKNKSKSGFAFDAGEHLMAVVGNQDSVLVLGRQGAILCDSGPVVFQDFEVGLAQVDHGLNGKSHPLLQLQALAELSEMQNLRVLMKVTSDAMAAELAHH